MLPKSLHTVTVLATVARMLKAANPSLSNDQAVNNAIVSLGYTIEQDYYNLATMAIKKLSK